MTDKANPELWKAALNSGNLNCYCKQKSDHANDGNAYNNSATYVEL